MASALGTVAGVVPQAPECSELELQLFPVSTHAGMSPVLPLGLRMWARAVCSWGDLPLPRAECPGLDRDLGVVMSL